MIYIEIGRNLTQFRPTWSPRAASSLIVRCSRLRTTFPWSVLFAISLALAPPPLIRSTPPCSVAAGASRRGFCYPTLSSPYQSLRKQRDLRKGRRIAPSAIRNPSRSHKTSRYLNICISFVIYCIILKILKRIFPCFFLIAWFLFIVNFPRQI